MKLTTGTRHVGCVAGSRWPWRASLSRRRSRRARRPDSWSSRPDVPEGPKWRVEFAAPRWPADRPSWGSCASRSIQSFFSDLRP